MRHVILLGIALAVWLAPAPSAAQVEIPRSVMANGCGVVSDTEHSLQGTVGQSAIGIVANPAHVHQVGFWYEWFWIPIGVSDPFLALPPDFALGPGVPNPFNPRVVIGYALPLDVHVALRLYDVSGRVVRTLVDEPIAAGYYTAVVDGSELPSGVYYCRMKAGTFEKTRSLVLVK